MHNKREVSEIVAQGATVHLIDITMNYAWCSIITFNSLSNQRIELFMTSLKTKTNIP